MTIENANSHPYKVTLTSESDGMFANSHPYKVTLAGGGGIGGKVVTELPAEGEAGYIYLVLKESTPEGNIYDEYMWVLLEDGETYGWEHLGATDEIDVGGTRLLTTEDYNWNSVNRSTTGTLDSFALWLLDDGLYSFDAGIPVSKMKTDKINDVPGAMPGNDSQASSVLILSSVDAYNRNIKTFIGSATNGSNGENAFFVLGTDTDGNARYGSGNNGTQYGLTRRDVVNDLNGGGNSGTSIPLSAYQGKVLKEMIDDAGGAKVLTIDDYNWNSQQNAAVEPYNCVAIWRLDPGYYYAQPNVILYKMIKTDTAQQTGGSFLVGWRGPNGTDPQIVTVIAMESTNWEVKVASVNLSNDSIYGGVSAIMRKDDIADTLASTATDQALSANQGKILNDKIGDIDTVLQTLTVGNGV